MRRAGEVGTMTEGRAVALLGLVALCLTGCPVDFKAVQAAGVAGQKIGDRAGALSAAPAVCLQMQALGGAKLDCGAVQKQADEWNKIALAVAAYATKLAALAQANDVTVTDQVNDALGAASKAKWGSLSSSQNSAIAAFANAVVVALSKEYRFGVLDEVIASVDPHIQRIAALIEGEIDIRISQLGDLSKLGSQVSMALQVPPPAPTLPAPPTPAVDTTAFDRWQLAVDKTLGDSAGNQASITQNLAQASGVGLAGIDQDLVAKKAAYLDLKAAVEAFRAAHATLAKNVGKLDAKDLLPQVLDVLKTGKAVVSSVAPSLTLPGIAAPTTPTPTH